MEIIKREYKVFNFDELSREAKDRAIEQYYQWEWENGYDFLEDDILNELDCIDEGYFEDNNGYQLYIAHSINTI